MSLRAIQAGRAFVDIIARDKYSKGLGKAQAKLRAFGVGVAKIGIGMAAGSAAVGGALFAITKGFATSGAALDDMSKRTGASVEALSELSFAAGQSGASLEDVEIALKKMQNTLTDAAGGGKAAVAALAKLGLTAQQLAGLSPDEQMMKIADGLDAIKDPAARTAAALDVFGKSGTKLLPMLEGGSAGLGALRQAARDAGLVMTTDMAQAAAKLDDGFDALWRTIGGLANQIGAALAPAMTEIIAKLTPIIADVGKWISQNPELVVAVGAAAVAIGALGAAAIVTGAAITGVVAILGAITSPITLAVAALGGLVAWFVTATEAGQRLGDIFGETFKGILSALGSGQWELAARIGWAGVMAAFYDLILPLREAWQNFISWVQKTWMKIRQKIGLADQADIDAISNENTSAIAALRKQAEDARAELKKLREEASKPIPAPSSTPGGKPLTRGRGPEDYPERPGAPDTSDRRKQRMAAGVMQASSRGTFSAAVAGRLAGSLGTEAQKATVASEKHLRKLIRLEERRREGTFG